ncbi:acyl-CoA/acyl-ACP dehydrogenase [Spiractinospora alimapuensis]|uniref:acyl-CoA dehydrogenase family protein n=1 Tax=Spiractinospora alimapuensis TaxID=2820884 RepID=UPI001F21B855|nr:acyl-CoA dehydrogenase family protein [Spiractinospora alimapuensis]QVQ51265.1 acyl-CoA/acyl-ACP dehydrogenase [Spiractinospora alimapuensis]
MAETDGPAGGSRSLDAAAAVAEQVLFPAALEVDTAERVPEGHFQRIAEIGFYGFAAPDGLNTLDLPDFASVCRAVETLAGGCLTTTFVWLQHHGAVTAAANTQNHALRDTYLESLLTGERRAGVAVTAAVRPGLPQLRAEPASGGWYLDGVAPWVTGWGMIDTLYVAARDANDALVMALVDAEESECLQAGPPARLVATNAGRTVTLRFSRYFLPRERVASITPRETYLRGDAETVRFNGNLALGVAGRAITLMGEDGQALSAQLSRTRDRLLSTTPEHVPTARAATSELAMRTAAALTTYVGGRSLLTDAHAQRLVREATFLLAFGTRPTIRSALLRTLSTREST